MSGTTSDPSDPRINVPKGPGEQNEVYLVLSEEDRAKGFVRPYRDTYVHRGERPKYPVRDLTSEELERFQRFGYVKFEEYPEGSPETQGGVVTGKYWTAARLESGCGQSTTMRRDIAETYARDPAFYGATWCVRCCKHLPVAEFVWQGTDDTVGS